MFRRLQRRLMYIPKEEFKPEVPVIVQNARTNFSVYAVVAFSTIGCFGLVAFQVFAKRQRTLEDTTRRGPRVIVLGGGSAGASTAALLTQHDPDVQVQVFEPLRQMTFTSLVPLAAAGHRSYDLCTFGPNTLNATTAWAVTRDASLQFNKAAKIEPETKTIVDVEGKTHKYDALVLAIGAKWDYSAVQGLSSDAVDHHGVCIHPHGARDGMCSANRGEVFCCKVPGKDVYCRNHEGNWISTVNTTWKFLSFFGKLDAGVKYTAVTGDETICDALPKDHVGQVEQFWEERGIPCKRNVILEAINYTKKQATFYDKETKERWSKKYRLLLLDLPLKAPEIIEKGGLSAPGLSGFVAVDEKTLQHKKYPEIFALGDCAALTNPKSYGACFSQAPVVAHNVLQYLQGKKPNAEYDGYSSFHINMSTWRVMWPQLVGDATEMRVPLSTGTSAVRRDANKERRLPIAGAAQRMKTDWYWDDSDWRLWKGFLQGVYIQWFAYEFMYWFCMLRGQWYPPDVLHPPLYEESTEVIEGVPNLIEKARVQKEEDRKRRVAEEAARRRERKAANM